MINGVILAGGLSKRMGRDKGLLEIDGKTAVEILYEKMLPVCENIFLVTNVPEKYQQFAEANGIRVLVDEIKQMGPLSGIHAALGETRTDYNLVIACDMPYADPRCFMEYCYQNAVLDGGYQLIIAKTSDGRIQPLHALYHKNSRDQIEQLLLNQEQKASRLPDYLHTYILSIESSDERMFQNINTPEEFSRLMAEKAVGNKNRI